MVTLTINGQSIQASPDRTILQVCHDHEIDHIPTLCYDPKLPPFGSCFLCVVEIEGAPRLFPACSTKVAEGMNIQTRSEKVVSARKTCLELLLSDHYADCFGPCRLNCPADVDIQGYMSLINLGKFHEAVALIKEKNPLPSVCGRVCTRKCEVNCRRTLVDAPVGIDFLKRYAADQDMIGDMWQPEMKPDNGHRVAIVGGGPAGLTCAYYLVLEGYRPTVYEALPHLGGMLRYGIPEYRLPKNVLQKEIEWITDLGVDIKTGTMLGRDITIDSLFQDGYEAVFVGLGAQVGKPMRVENEDVKGVLSGVEFLREVEMGTNPDIGGKVVVVGGGNTAIDAARTSLRLGAAEVVLLYRRTRAEMPANEMEIVAAEEEGVKMEFLAAPVCINTDTDRLESITCIRMELGEPDDSGRRRPVKIDGSDYNLSCDWVISAIGQEPDLSGVGEGDDINVTRWKTIEAKRGTFDTDRPGVFSGGDVVTGPADAIDAIAAGRMAARAVDRYIQTGKVEPFVDRFESRRDNFHKLTRDDIPQVRPSERHGMPERSIMERINSFQEVETGYDQAAALEESIRCAECGCDVGLSCILQDYCTEYGVDQKRFVGEFSRYEVDTRHPFIKIDSNKCIRCGRCVNTCSEILNVSALGFVNRGFRTIVKPAMEKALQNTNCVSCGNCIDVCPTGALVEKMPFRRSGPWKMESQQSICTYCSVGCNLTLKVKTPDIFYVTGAPPESMPNHGELCVRGRFGYQHFLDGSRVKTPRLRDAGKLVDTSWEKALTAAADGLKRVIDEHGPDAVMIAASPKLTNEELYLAGRLGRAVVGTNNIASFHRLTNEGDYNALDAMFGETRSTATVADVENADLYLFVGGNPTIENPVLGWQMKRRMRHGTEAVVINSADIDLVKHATAWADARRGTATVLLNGIVGELIRTGRIDEAYITEHTANFDQVRDDLAKRDLSEVSSVTGVSVATIQHIVGILSDPAKKVVAWYNLDSRVDRAAGDLKALATLMLLLGKAHGRGNGIALMSSQANHAGMQLAGCDRYTLPGGLPAGHDDMLRELSALWHTDVKALIDGSGTNLNRKMREDRIRAAVILGENPAADEALNSFLHNLEYVVVADLFNTESAQMADVFLPLATFLESHGHLTNWAGLKQQGDPIAEPENGQHNYETILRLSQLLGDTARFNHLEEVTGELALLSDIVKKNRTGAFATADGKARFVLFSDQVLPIGARAPRLVETDRRMAERMSAIRA